jgi:hypothetical protein
MSAKAARRVSGVVVIAVLLVAGLVTGFVLYGGAASTRAVERAPGICPEKATGSLRCHRLSTGIWAVVYPPVEAPPKGGAELVLWDAGGPGLRPLDAAAARRSLPAWLRDRTVVALVEPWVTNPVPAACLKTVEETAAGDPVRHERRVDWSLQYQKDCSLDKFRLDPREYAESFRELQAEEGVFRGVYAQSFGAVRATGVFPDLARNDGWAVLEAPAAPPGTTAPAWLSDRAAAVTKGLLPLTECGADAGAAASAPDGPAARGCALRLHALLVDMGAGPGRRTGPNADDYARMTGLLSLSADLHGNASRLEGLLAAWPKLSDADQDLLDQGSLDFTRRHGDGQVQAEFVGYLANVCPAYRGWGHGTGAPADKPIAAALTRMHHPCSAAPAPVDGTRWTLPEPADTPRLLLAANTEDPVTTPAAARAWRTAYPAVPYVPYRYGGHIKAPDDVDARIARWVGSGGS